MRPMNTIDERLSRGQWHTLLSMLRIHDEESFVNYLRMPPVLFDELLHKVEPLITKKDTNLRKALEPGLKLALTLRHSATGDQ